MSDNIISIDVIRIERHKPRKCTCDEKDKKFTVDTQNREVTCDCGMVVDPFEALMYLANHYERINNQHKALYEQAQEWKKEKPYSVLFKGLERDYQRGKMLPTCPKCGDSFDFKNISGWRNAEFFRKLEQSRR